MAAADAASDDLLSGIDDTAILDGTDDGTAAEAAPVTEEEVETPATDVTEETAELTDEDVVDDEAAPAAGEVETPAAEGVDAEADQARLAEEAAAAAAAKPPAAAPPAPTAEQKAAEEGERKAQQEFTQWESDFAAVTARLEKGDLDALDDREDLNKAIKVIARGMTYVKSAVQQIGAERVEQTTAEQQRQNVEATWQRFGQANPGLPMDQVRAAWNEEVAAVVKKYPSATRETIQAVASERFDPRLNTFKAQAARDKLAGKKPGTAAGAAPPARPGPPKAPVTRGGASVTPRGGTARPPRPRAKTPEEEFDEGVGVGGRGGGMKDFLS